MRRWDVDERGHGVTSAGAAVPDLDRLRGAMLEADWVTEDPEVHLLPHVQRLARDRGWRITRAAVADAVLEVDVEVPDGTWRSLRETGFALIGTFAEASTHVVETKPDAGREVELLVTTGMLAGDGEFAPHGHVVRLAVHSA